MSLQRLGPKWLRRLSGIAGEPVKIGWANGGNVMWFATESHRHGSWDTRNEVLAWDESSDRHVTSCYGEEWPEELRAVHPAPLPRVTAPTLAPAVFIEPPAFDEPDDPEDDGQYVRWVPASELAR